MVYASLNKPIKVGDFVVVMPGAYNDRAGLVLANVIELKEGMFVVARFYLAFVGKAGDVMTVVRRVVTIRNPQRAAVVEPSASVMELWKEATALAAVKATKIPPHILEWITGTKE